MGKYNSTTALKKITQLIQDNIQTKKYFIIYGGSCSSKTVSILMLLINHCIQTPKQRIFIVSDELAKMKKGLIMDFIDIMQDFNLFQKECWRNNNEYSFPNGSIIIFTGSNDGIEQFRGVRSNFVYANEISRCNYDTLKELFMRTDIVLGDFNPSRKFWVDDMIIPRRDCCTLVLTYKDNEYAKESEVNELFSYKERGFDENGNVIDEYFANLWRIYGEGKRGSSIGAVFQNWSIGEFIGDDDYNTIYGLDFGFSKDPDALTKVHLDKKTNTLYIKECFYQNGNSEDQLAEYLRVITKGKKIIADSAEDRLISDLKKKGVNISAVRKPKLEVSIKAMHGYRLVISPESKNLQDELSQYVWLDKNEKTIPIDKYNHLIDSARYALEFLTHEVQQDEVIILNYR